MKKAFRARLWLLLLLATRVVLGQSETTTLRAGIFPLAPLNFINENGVAEGLNPDLLREIVRDITEAKQLAGKKTGDPAWCFVHEDQSVRKVQEYPVSQVIATGGKISNQIVGIQRPDREEITWVLINAVPVFAKTNELDRIIVNAMDITQRKDMEDKLKTHLNELERFNKASVGRELRMIELKNEINTLSQELDRSELYTPRK